MDKFCLTGRIRRAAASSSTVARRAAGLQACAFALAWQHHGTRLLAAMHSWRSNPDSSLVSPPRQSQPRREEALESYGHLDPTISTCIVLPCGPCLLFFLATMALGLLELGGFDYAPHTAIATAEARCHEQTDRNLTCRSIVNLHDGTQLLSSLTEGLGPEVRDCWRWKSDSAEQQSSRAAILVVGARSYLLAWRGRC